MNAGFVKLVLMFDLVLRAAVVFLVLSYVFYVAAPLLCIPYHNSEKPVNHNYALKLTGNLLDFN